MGFVEKEFRRLNNWLIDNGYSDRITEREAICPICQRSKKIEEFTKEHIVPASIGGKQQTVTCSQCNSICGHEFDYSLGNFLNHQQLNLLRPSGNSNLTIGNVSINTITEVKNGIPTITIYEKNNSPETLRSFREELERNPRKFTLNTKSKWNQYKLCRAFIKMFQLMSLPQDGYLYVLDICGRKISEIILGKCECDITKFTYIITSYQLSTGSIENGYYKINLFGINIRFCIIKLKRVFKNDSLYFAMLLPGSGCDWNSYAEANSKFSELIKTNEVYIELSLSLRVADTF